jgi:hypothetical protein
LLAAPLLVAAAAPIGGPLRLQLNLGPGDAPYVTGFSPVSEVEDTIGLHWSGPEGRMSLPLDVEGPLTLSLRLARILPQAADVAIILSGRSVLRFSCRGGAVIERAAAVEVGWTPASAGLRVSSADDKGRALRLDWLRFDVGRLGRIRLRGFAVLRPALLVLVLFVVLRSAGFGSAAGALLVAPWVATGLVLLRRDPWLAHRLLTWLPEALALLGFSLIGVCRALERRRLLWAGDTRLVVAVAAAAFVLRAGILNHPDYWYPDLHSHARLVEIVRAAGWDFFRQPAKYIWEQGIWVHQAYDQVFAMPYTPGFHLFFALLPIDRENVVTFMKLGAVALCSVPMLALAILARHFGASPAGVVLLALVPAYGIRLVLALLAAIFGHAIDLTFLVWLARRLRAVIHTRVWLVGTLLCTACCLAYVSSVVILPLFLSLVALLLLLEGRAERFRATACILSIGALGGLLAFVLYYRGFSAFIFDMVQKVALGVSSGSDREVHPLLQVLNTRSLTFFGPLVPVLALFGLWRLLREQPESRVFLGAWALTYMVLLFGRARFPDIFDHTHDVLFVAPLLCLAAGDTLARLAQGGGWRRGLAAAAVLAIAVQGLSVQWSAFLQQFGYAL